MEYLVFLDHFEASPKKLIEASGKIAAREAFRREVMIHSRPFLEMAYGRSGPGAWITTHLATCPDIDGPAPFTTCAASSRSGFRRLTTPRHSPVGIDASSSAHRAPSIRTIPRIWIR